MRPPLTGTSSEPGYAASMAPKRDRAALVPNANNPRLLLRMVSLISVGIRQPRALSQILGVEVRTVHYYTQAAEWLGLLAGETEPQLTDAGLDLAFAEPGERMELYAQAVWNNPLAAEILQDGGQLPETPSVAALIRTLEPTMSATTARRRASAVRGLLKPAVGRKPSATRSRGLQMALPFRLHTPATSPAVALAWNRRVDLRAGAEDNPDVYGRILTNLLDHGELNSHQFRAVLDAMGAQDAGIGTYTEMAIRRGDAVRLDNVLVATRGAQKRRELAGDGVLIAFTDPGYRAYLELLIGADDSDEHGRVLVEQRARWNRWDLRLFGGPLNPDNVRAGIRKALRGRQLEGLPEAGEPIEQPAEADAPFLQTAIQSNTEALALCFPSSLVQCAGGIRQINALLTTVAQGPLSIRPPSPVDLRLRVHGGLVAPGEALPRAIPDTLSLRLRCLTHVPATSLLVCLLLLARRPDIRLEVRRASDGTFVHHNGRNLGGPIQLFESFCLGQGWLPLHPSTGGLTDEALAELSLALGLSKEIRGKLVLQEDLFGKLTSEAEATVVQDPLTSLEDKVHAWLEALSEAQPTRP